LIQQKSLDKSILSLVKVLDELVKNNFELDFLLTNEEKSEELLNLLAEKDAQQILQKKLASTDLDTEETKQALAWQIYEENRYEHIEADIAVLKITLQQHVVNLKKEMLKRERTAAAKAMTKK
jgi:hypothetical protein